jgi:hypothetical protein
MPSAARPFTFAMMLACVRRKLFGVPVVPEVNTSMQSMSGAIAGSGASD